MLDNVKKKKEEIYREIGLKISSQRKRKRKKFKSISKTLNISIEYLNLIEEGKINELPQHIPVMGFVRSYARFVEAEALDIRNDLISDLADDAGPPVISCSLEYVPAAAELL